MKQVLGLVAAIALLAACDDRSAEDWNGGGEGGGEGEETPEVTFGAASVGDVEAVSFDGETLRVQIALDGNDLLEEYETKGPSDIVNGYQRFTQNASSLNRSFTALAGESDDGSLLAVVTADGSQFNRFLGGATVVQNAFSAPTGGLVSYHGSYAGLINGGTEVPTTTTGAPDIIAPAGTTNVTGSVFLTADFTDNKIEGALYDRVWIDGGTEGDQPLDPLTLIVGDVAADGTFAGSVEIGQGSDAKGAGSYSGTFGGTDAAFAGGVLDIGVAAYPDGTDTNLKEYGIFIIGQCPDGAESCFVSPP